MANTLTKLKAMVQTYEGYNFADISIAEKDEMISFVKDAVQLILWEIENEFETNSTESEKFNNISSIQFQISFIASGIDRADYDTGHSKPNSETALLLRSEFFKLLDFLKEHFSAYFDLSQKLPPDYLDWHLKKFSGIDQLNSALTILEADPDLKNVLESILGANQYSGAFAINTWGQLAYFQQLITALQKILENPPIENLNLEILKLFINMDFNSIHVYGYFVKYMERFTLEDANFQEQQQELLYMLKVFRQVRVDTKIPYDAEIPPLKTSVIESLEAEINYLEQREKLYMQNFRATNPESPSKFYFNVAITLAELMFFFRIMLEVKVITTKFNAYLYEFISNHIRTANAENLSKKSMRNHFNNKPFPERNVQNVRNWLVKLMAHIDMYYSV